MSQIPSGFRTRITNQRRNLVENPGAACLRWGGLPLNESCLAKPILCLLVLTVSLSCGPGCSPTRMFQNPFRPPVPCVLSPDPSLTEVVNHINDNIGLIHGWRSTDVSIQAAQGGGMSVRLSAVIAVEQTRRFRLSARSPFGNEADFGSNDERFWFFMKRLDAHHVYTVAHNEMHMVQDRLQIPFEPDWLMEVLGVIPIIGAEFELHPDLTDSGVLSLVSERVSPNGEPVRRVILVDKCRGHVVAHSLYDASNQLIAKAELSRYEPDSTSGAMLPHRIGLEWPQAGLKMTMNLGGIEVNPVAVSEQTWQPFRTPTIQHVDLAR